MQKTTETMAQGSSATMDPGFPAECTSTNPNCPGGKQGAQHTYFDCGQRHRHASHGEAEECMRRSGGKVAGR